MPTVVTTLAGWRELTAQLRGEGASLGVTPTLGALHQGHRSLLARSASERDVALATIFVNPLQFDRPEDLAAYRIDLDDDLAVAADAGVTAVFCPSVAEMWPSWPGPTKTVVAVPSLASRFEGEQRPGHFDGVATVVTKLLCATGPAAAYFGEKDYQQLCIVRQLVADLALPNEVVACPTVREPDGLACSSRNARLSSAGRVAAAALPRALFSAHDELATSGDVTAALRTARDVVADEPSVSLAYAAAVRPDSLEPVASVSAGEPLRLLLAAVVEGVRLIDNVGVVAGPR